ncbi:MAG: mucoidy inhibitor MuiA family protein [Hyphomicrobiaceae bacterium]
MMFLRSVAVLFGMLFVAVPSSVCSAEPVTVFSRIDAVKVFPSGAEVVRTARVRIAPDAEAVVFRDLPPEAVAGSIRVDGKASGRLEIGAVDTRRLFVPQHSGESTENERKRLEKEIEALEDQRKLAEAKVAAADTQRTLIGNLTNLPNRPPPAPGTAAPAENWSDIIALIDASLTDIARHRLEAEAAVRDLERQINDLRGKLAALAPNQEERTEVTVAVKVDQPVQADFTVRYRVPNASWSQSYDARLKTGTKTDAPSLAVMRRATITQRTGESWNDVAIQLSTTRPSAGTAAPELGTMSVDYPPEVAPVARPATGRGMMGYRKDGAIPEAMETPMADAAPAAPKMRVAARSMANVNVALFQATYGVLGRATVKNTGEAKSLDLLADNFAPSLVARSVPKRSTTAYLYAKIEVPRGSPMLPGTVALFRDGTFVGNGRLPLLAGGDTHELGFGSDDLVRVRHSLVKESRGETGLISSSKTDERNYRISIKNLHERSIDVSVYDQLPVSKNEEIKVESLGRPAPSARNVDDKAGVVRWDARLEATEEKVIEFGYRVVWPAAKTIQYRGR